MSHHATLSTDALPSVLSLAPEPGYLVELAPGFAVRLAEEQLRALVASALRAQLTDWTEEQED